MLFIHIAVSVAIYTNVNYFAFLKNLLVDRYISFFPGLLSSNTFSANGIIVLHGVHNSEIVAAI